MVIIGISFHFVFKQEFNIDNFIDGLIHFDKRIELAQTLLSKKDNSGDQLRQGVAKLLVPKGLGDVILYAPVRTLLWIFLPYPLMFPDLHSVFRLPDMVHSDHQFYISVTSDLFRIMRSWVFIFLAPAMLATLLHKSDNRVWLLVPIVVSSILISNLMVLESTRYRVLIDPLLLALALWGQRPCKPKGYVKIILPMLILIPFLFLIARA